MHLKPQTEGHVHTGLGSEDAAETETAKVPALLEQRSCGWRVDRTRRERGGHQRRV